MGSDIRRERKKLLSSAVKGPLADTQRVSQEKMPCAKAHRTGAEHRTPQKCKQNKQKRWMLMQSRD